MPRRIFIEIGVGAVLLLAGFLAGVGVGRFASPARVTTDIKTIEKVRLQAVEKEHAEEHDTSNTQEDSGGELDGTETTTTEETTDAEGVKHKTTTVTREGRVVWGQHVQTENTRQLSLDLQRQVNVESDTRTESHTVVENAPRINLGLGLGGELQFNPWGAGPVLLVEGSYRIVGPLGIGGWAMFSTPPSWPPTGVNFVGGGVLLTLSL